MAPRQVNLPLPLIGAIAATRGMLGAGIGLLVSGKISDDRRRRVGLTLLSIGIASTIPFMWRVLRKERHSISHLTS